MSTTAELFDSHGLTVVAAMVALPPQPSRWPRVERISLSGLKSWRFFDAWHEKHKQCWLCGATESHEVRIDAHHAARSDELACLFPLCFQWTTNGGCHMNVEGRLAELIWCQAVFVPEEADWTRLATLRIPRRKLPEPKPPSWIDPAQIAMMNELFHP
jgi:hypothetical protein